MPGNSCVSQLLSVTHKIYKYNPSVDIRRVFLDISKTFDKVFHEGLILKLSRNGIFGNLLNVLRGFIKHQKQRLLLIYQNSSWKKITSGVPKESFSVPLLFLSYVKNLSESLFSN